MGRIRSTRFLEAILAPTTTNVSSGVCFPGGPVSIVDFAQSEITHITADEGMPPTDGNTSAPRCAGDPFSTDVRPDLPGEHDTGTSLQEQIADLRAQLQRLEDIARTEPILTREQAYQRDVAIEKLQIRTLAALGSLENGEAL